MRTLVALAAVLAAVGAQQGPQTGVPLSHATSGGPMLPQDPFDTVLMPLGGEGVGIPLPDARAPPYDVIPVQDPSAFGGVGGIRGVRDPQQDPDILRVLRMFSVRQQLQRSMGADAAVRIQQVITAHKQVRICLSVCMSVCDPWVLMLL